MLYHPKAVATTSLRLSEEYHSSIAHRHLWTKSKFPSFPSNPQFIFSVEGRILLLAFVQTSYLISNSISVS